MAERSDLPDGRLAEPLEALDAGVPPELVELGRWVGEEYCSTTGRGLGLVLPPGVGTGAEARRVKPLVELEVEATPEGIAAADGGERLGLRQKAVLRALIGGPQTARRLASAAGSDRATLRRLESRGLVRTREVERRRLHSSPGVGAVTEGVELTGDQRAVLERVVGSLPDGEGGGGGSFLLHGVTGSGKTEVYLEAARETLARGRGAIVLVPEIALTPQTMDRFRRRFGDARRLASLEDARRGALRRVAAVRSGEARICVGPRSAVFAPMRDPGLIVIDEEHDSSYKQESDPRYDAREVARRRAAEAGAVLLCGTATPRPESWHELERIELPSRVDGRPLPPVEIVDMRGGVPGPLHPRTREAFGQVAREGGKAILLINRRGWSTHLTCRSCGHAWECPNCDVSLILHRDNALRCHHCGHAEPMPEACPECSSVTIARVGSGTQRVEAELDELLAPLEVFRLDSDSAAGSGHTEVLRRFEAADVGRAGRHPDGREGTRLPRRDAERDPRRRWRAAPAGLPLRGADLRADHAARRPQRAGRRWWARARPGAGHRRSEHPPRHQARCLGVPRGGDRAAARASLPALLASDRNRAREPGRGPGRDLGREGRRARRRAPRSGRRAARPGAALPSPRASTGAAC